MSFHCHQVELGQAREVELEVDLEVSLAIALKVKVELWPRLEVVEVVVDYEIVYIRYGRKNSTF